MQVYGRGLRRRLPPMLDGDQARLRMLYSLLFSLPGIPVMFYGEEIGMGENLAVGGRGAVRTPMQWTDGPGAGFSTAKPSTFPAPVTEGRFGPMAVNVARQRRDPGSLLNWFERLTRRRKETPEIGFGTWRVLASGSKSVLVHRCDWEGSAVIAVHNFSADPYEIEIEVDDADRRASVDDLLGSEDVSIDGGKIRLTVEGYGYYWLRMPAPGQRPVP
jgi:maltose alpha-D-glucosyltransferase/alpha-amylase